MGDDYNTNLPIASLRTGIDPEVMYKLFEKFVSKFEKGTGLGLFISKSIVEAHMEVRYGLKTIRIEREQRLPSHCL